MATLLEDCEYMMKFQTKTQETLRDFFKTLENNDLQASKILLLKSKQALLSENILVTDSIPDTPHMKSAWLMLNCDAEKDDLPLLYRQLLDQKKEFETLNV